MIKLIALFCIISTYAYGNVDVNTSTGTYTVDKFGADFMPAKTAKASPFSPSIPTLILPKLK